MHLDGDLADANFSGYLLVHLTRCHQRDDIALTQRKGLEAGSHVGDGFCVMALSAVAIERNPNCVQKVLLADRLRQKLHRTSFHRLDGHRDIAVSGDEDDRSIDVQLDEFGLNVESAQPRQSDVKYQTAGSIRAHAPEEFPDRCEGHNLQAYRLKEIVKHLPYLDLVAETVNDPPCLWVFIHDLSPEHHPARTSAH